MGHIIACIPSSELLFDEEDHDSADFSVVGFHQVLPHQRYKPASVLDQVFAAPAIQYQSRNVRNLRTLKKQSEEISSKFATEWALVSHVHPCRWGTADLHVGPRGTAVLTLKARVK